MRAVVVVAVDSCPELEPGIFDGLETVAPAELLLEGLDEVLAQAVLRAKRSSTEMKPWQYRAER